MGLGKYLRLERVDGGIDQRSFERSLLLGSSLGYRLWIHSGADLSCKQDRGGGISGDISDQNGANRGIDLHSIQAIEIYSWAVDTEYQC